MRVMRVSQLTTIWNYIRVFVMVALAATASFGLQRAMSPIAAAEEPTPAAPEIQLLPPAEPESVSLTDGDPTPVSPASGTTVRPESAVMTWTATGIAGIQDGYMVRIATSLDEATGELVAPSEYPSAAAEYALQSPGEYKYYWQVKKCDPAIGCVVGSWSAIQSFNVDATPPPAPTAQVVSDAFDVKVRMAGIAEANSRITVKTSNKVCETAADTDGEWTCEFTGIFEYGEHRADVTSVDAAGNATATTLDFSVKELFVSPQITTSELPPVLNIVPANQAPKNSVYMQPVAAAVDVLGASPSQETDSSAAIRPLSTDGGIIQSSSSGWQVLGLPWFIWLGGLGFVGASWWMFGLPVPRRQVTAQTA